jgi:hypothetical protein
VKFFKRFRGPQYICNIPKDAKIERAKKTREIRKKTHKDPNTAENPKHPNKNPKTLYNISSQQPSYFFPK